MNFARTLRRLLMGIAIIATFNIAPVTTSAGLVLPSAGDVRFGWELDAPDSMHAYWNGFAGWTAAATPFAPNAGVTAGNTTSITRDSGFITSSNGVYSFNSSPNFDVALDTSNLSGDYTRIVAQFKTLGSVVQTDAIFLSGNLAPTYGETLFYGEVASDFGTAYEHEYLAYWDVTGSLDDYLLEFQSYQHASLLELKLDAYSSSTPFGSTDPAAVPEPSTLVLLGSCALLGIPAEIRRRKLMQTQAAAADSSQA